MTAEREPLEFYGTATVVECGRCRTLFAISRKGWRPGAVSCPACECRIIDEAGTIVPGFGHRAARAELDTRTTGHSMEPPPGFAPCTRPPGHAGPCAHPEA